MGGFFGVASKSECKLDVFFGTDYHSHLGTRRAGMAFVAKDGSLSRIIHDISNSPFRSRFEEKLDSFSGNMGMGVISDFDAQPLIIRSHLGEYAIVTVGIINNTKELIEEVCQRHAVHFSETSLGEINMTELAAVLINEGESFVDGIQNLFKRIDGSCSLMLLTKDGLYAARDYYGRTPIILGEKDGARAFTMESTAFLNLGYSTVKELGPGEIVKITPDGTEQILAPCGKRKVCAFFWVYYGFPASTYEGLNVEKFRYAAGQKLAENDKVEIDLAAGVPDSGTGYAIGYSNARHVPFGRPFTKYTPTWARSFMPTTQSVREVIARMKILVVKPLLDQKRVLFTEDSIVRGTQLRDIVSRVFSAGAKEMHFRSACPPYLFTCKYLNFSRSGSNVLSLAARRAINHLEGFSETVPEEYLQYGSEKYEAMVDYIRKEFSMTTLRYQNLDDMLDAIGLPKDEVCTFCWTGKE